MLATQIAQNLASFSAESAANARRVITYEYPLNERIRTLLRLEDLYARVRHFLVRDDPHDHHACLTGMFEILEVASRADLKSDLLQELDRQRTFLDALRSNPAISPAPDSKASWRPDSSSCDGCASGSPAHC